MKKAVDNLIEFAPMDFKVLYQIKHGAKCQYSEVSRLFASKYIHSNENWRALDKKPAIQQRGVQ